MVAVNLSRGHLRNGPAIIPLIATGTQEQFRDKFAAIGVHASQQHLDRLDAYSRPTLRVPVGCHAGGLRCRGIYGAKLPDIDNPRVQAVRLHHHRHLVVCPRFALMPSTSSQSSRLPPTSLTPHSRRADLP